MAGPIDDNFGEKTTEPTQLQRDIATLEQSIRLLRDNTAYTLRAIGDVSRRQGTTALTSDFSAGKRTAMAQAYNAFRTALNTVSDRYGDIPTAANLPANPVPEQ